MVTTHSLDAEPKRLAFHCPDCDGPQMFQVRSVDKSRGEDGLWEEFTFAVCARCQKPVLLRRYDYGGGFDDDEYYRAYPALERQISFALPAGVRRAYDEAVKTEQAKAWSATAVMAGQALEAICRDYDHHIRTISDGLQKLLAAGVISQELFDWGNSLRVVRNRGAHANSRPVTADDARFALDFLQALLEILYSLRRKFEVWKKEAPSSESESMST